MSALDEGVCPRCHFLLGGTFCQFECEGGQSPDEQAREAFEYDLTAAFDEQRERYAGETGVFDDER